MPSIDGRAHAHAPNLRELFDRARTDAPVRIEPQQAIYASGDEDDSMYLIESGQVKLSMASAEGKDCLLAIYTTGEAFGESCFGGVKRFESATAMQPTVVRRALRRELLNQATRAATMETLLIHVVARLAERQTAIFDLVTMPSERRLAKVLLGFAEKLGRVEGKFVSLDRISHEELSQMVGTTRPRVTAFMQKFRTLGLIERSGRAIKVDREKTRRFLEGDE
jgi:CRP/FNR family transcriptional regulator, cyclic AMP receptor protein